MSSDPQIGIKFKAINRLLGDFAGFQAELHFLTSNRAVRILGKAQK